MVGAQSNCLGVLDSHAQSVIDYWENELWMEIVEEKDSIINTTKGK